MDILGGAPEPEFDGDVEETKPGFLSEPSTLALIAFPLSILVILGTSVFRGLSYTFAAAPSQGALLNDSGFEASTTYLTAGAFLSAAFSLLPIAFGYRGLQRLISDDPAWVGALLRASIVLAGLSFALRLVIAVLVAADADSGNAYLNFAGLT